MKRRYCESKNSALTDSEHSAESASFASGSNSLNNVNNCNYHCENVQIKSESFSSYDLIIDEDCDT